MRIVLDTTILVRGTEASNGIARRVLLDIAASSHALILSNETLYELAKVLRYPRLLSLYGLTEDRVYDFTGFLREIADIVELDPLLVAPIRDINDLVVLQTAIVGEAEVICTTDEDFYEAETIAFLKRLGISVMTDIELMSRLRS